MAISDYFHKTLAYFGMAENDYDEYDEYDDGDPEPSTHVRDSDRSHRGDRQSGRDREPRRSPAARSGDFDDIYSDPGVPSPSRGVRAVASPRSSRGGEVNLIVPRSFNDAQQIADKFKGTVPVILNLQSADAELAKRLIDFASGLTYALDGGMSRIADKVFLLTPRNVEVSAEERARILEKGFYNQS
ncbi:MAG: cell division protein SepF [Thermoleophilia bacterium]|nr:cell division protein SepF [Thermoleophilia bacterium]